MVWFEEPEEFHTEVVGALVQQACGGELHEGVRQAPVWRSRDAQRAVDKEIAESDARYGQRAVDVDDPEWRDLAELLSTPPEARFGRVSYMRAGEHYDVYAARNNWFGVVVATQGTHSHVRTFYREHPAEAIVASLADLVWRSEEQPIRVARSDLDGPDDAFGFREPHPHIARIRKLTQLPAYLTAEFHVECRNGDGQRRRSERPLLVYGLRDEMYDAGCWTLQVTPRGRDTDLQFAPADVHDLAQRIEQLRRRLD